MEELEDYDSDKEIKGDDIETSTLIHPEDNPLIIEFPDVFPKDSTLISPESPLWLRCLLMSFLKILETNCHRSVTSNTLLSLI